MVRVLIAKFVLHLTINTDRMDIYSIFIIIMLASGVSAFLIAKKIADMLAARQNKWATVVGVLSFIAFFMLIAFIIIAIVLSNMAFGR